MPRRLAPLVLLLALGCGAEDSGGPAGTASTTVPVSAAELEGSTYVSSEVVGHDLVEGTLVRLAFDDGSMAVSAGCNTQTGPYDVSAGVLAWTQPPASTVMGCLDDLTAQDDWLGELLFDGVTAALEGGTLTLSSADVVLTLRSGPDLESVLGKSWTVVATVDGRTSASIPDGVRRPRLSVGADGLSSIDTGCNNGRITVRVDGEALVFGRPQVTRGRCSGPARAVQDQVLAVLDGRTDRVELDGSVLVLTKGERGLVVEVG